MYRVVLMLLLAGMNSNAMAKAEPVEVGNGFGGDRVFVYPDTIKKSGGAVTMWDLFNSSTPQNLAGHSPYLSKISEVQYDCAEKRMRTLYTNVYSEKDGKGAKIFFEDTSTLLNWQQVTSDAAHEALFEFACGKKQAP